MRKFAMTVAAAAFTVGTLATGVGIQTAQAAQTPNDTNVSTPAPAPSVQLLACNGTTGSEGCGPGWYWRNGALGWHCYPCGT
jgi:hypothetical protein